MLEPGWPIRIAAQLPGEQSMTTLLSPGVVWECQRLDGIQPRMSLTAYDQMIYLAKSEDERLMPAKQTASQRLKLYAKEWSIPLGSVPDTKKGLSRDIKRTQSIFSMIMGDLKETAGKGGTIGGGY